MSLEGGRGEGRGKGEGRGGREREGERGGEGREGRDDCYTYSDGTTLSILLKYIHLSVHQISPKSLQLQS